MEPLRKLCFEDIDRAMELGLRMSLEEIRSRGEDAYKDTVDAYQWYKKNKEERDMLTAEQIAAIAAKALEDKKARDIKVLRTTEQTVLADYFVICNGTSSTHIKGAGGRGG